LNLLEGNTILLRAPEPEDLENLYRWENDTDIWQVSNTIVPFSRFTLRSYIENAHRDIYETQQIRFMIDATNQNPFQTVGTIDVFDFDPYHNRAGVGILIGKLDERGKGYAKEAINVLVGYAFSILKLHQLYCNISISNLSSIKLFQNCGFEITGEKKEWIKSLDGWQNECFLQRINPK
jgi:diamine N-acetyltransferase